MIITCTRMLSWRQQLRVIIIETSQEKGLLNLYVDFISTCHLKLPELCLSYTFYAISDSFYVKNPRDRMAY